MTTKLFQQLLLLTFFFQLCSTMTQAKGNYHAPETVQPSDTIDRVSMMFFVRHGKENTINLHNHPFFKRDGMKFTFTATGELPRGMTLTKDGLLSWYPDKEQFLSLQKKARSIPFRANSTQGNVVVLGEVRIVSEGELSVEAVPEQKPSQSPEKEKAQNPETQNSSEKPAAVATAKPKKAKNKAAAEPAAEPVAADTVKPAPVTLVKPVDKNWNRKKEGETFSFTLKATGGSGNYTFELLEPEFLMPNLDKYGHFKWQPGYDFAGHGKDFRALSLKVRVFDDAGNETTDYVVLTVQDVNRPPVVEDLPTFYIRYNKLNRYDLKGTGLVYDPDGDSIIFKPVLKELPQGMNISPEGIVTWKPSVRQFRSLRSKPVFITFIVEDFPHHAGSTGQIQLAISMEDLPPQLTMVPNKENFTIEENEELHLNFFISDPNGDDDLLTFSFLSENKNIPEKALEKKENGQYEFNWTPDFDFIQKAGGSEEFTINFFALDKEGNRTEKSISVTVKDKENLLEKDRILYDQYRTVLERAYDLVSQLKEKEKELEKKYKNAKKGKKNWAITTAGLGALTGLSPVIFLNSPDGQKVAAGLGGTATATIGTLDASNVLGEEPADIMRDLNYVTQKISDLVVYGNVFASKYALPLSRRSSSFQPDLRGLSIHLNLKEISKLDLDASWENPKKATDKNIRKLFKDFNPDPRFSENYK